MEAFQSVVDHLPEMRRRVYDYIVSRGSFGATGDEVALHLGRRGTINGRTTELHKMGLIRPAGERPTRSGRKATVYVACQPGGSTPSDDTFVLVRMSKRQLETTAIVVDARSLMPMSSGEVKELAAFWRKQVTKRFSEFPW